jgi:hypothetical protein
MSLIAWVSVKGGRGASTAGLALAGVWPATRKILFAELDPSGGDLVARFELAPDPGLVQLGAAFRHALSAEEVWSHTQTLNGGVPVLVGPASAQQGHALGPLWEHLAPVLAALPETDVIADCGRLEPSSPAIEIARRADLIVAVARPTLEGVAHLRARLATAMGRAPVGVVLIGDSPYSASEVEAAVGARVLGVVANDERAARVLNGELGNASALNRSLLMRSARGLAVRICGIVSGLEESRHSQRAASEGRASSRDVPLAQAGAGR